MPCGSVDMQSGFVGLLFVGPSGKDYRKRSVSGEICGDLPSGAVELTGPDVSVEGGGVSLGAGLAAGVTGAVGAAAVGLGLPGRDNEPEGEVRPFLCVIDCCIGFRGKSSGNVSAMVTVNTSLFYCSEVSAYKLRGECWAKCIPVLDYTNRVFFKGGTLFVDIILSQIHAVTEIGL